MALIMKIGVIFLLKFLLKTPKITIKKFVKLLKYLMNIDIMNL